MRCCRLRAGCERGIPTCYKGLASITLTEPRVGMTSVISNSAAAQILPERGQSEPAAVDLGADVHAHQATQDTLDG